MTRAITLAWALVVALLTTDAEAAVVPARVIAIEGAAPTGAPMPVSNVFQPFVHALGEVAFAGTLGGGESFLFVGDQLAWLSSDESAVVTSVQNSVGTTAAGEFVFRATIDGELGLWTHVGALGRAGDPAPGFPLFPTASFVSPGDCTMDGAGAVYWRANVDITNDDSPDVGGLFRAPDGADGSIEALYRSGGMVDGVTLHGGTNAIVDEFAVSDDGAHVVARLNAAGNTFADQLVVLDGGVVVREGEIVPSFPLSHWRALDLVAVNDTGKVLFTGNTDADPSVDEFVAFGDDIQVREGDVLDGVQVAFDLRFVALDDRNHAAIGWATDDAGPIVEVVFFACDAADIAGTAEVLVAVGDTIDVDGDASGDFTVADVVGAGNEGSRVLGDRDVVYLELDLDPDDLDAIVEIPVTCCGNGVTNGGEECDDGNDVDDDACTNACTLPPDSGSTSDVESSSSSDAGSDSTTSSEASSTSSSSGVGTSSTSTGDDTTQSTSDATSAGSTDTSATESGSTSTGPGPTSSSSDSSNDSSSGASSDSTGSTSASSDGSGSTHTQGSSTDTTTSGGSTTTETGTSGTMSGGTAASTSTDAGTESDGDDGGMTARGDGCGCAATQPRGTLFGLGLLVLGLRRRRATATAQAEEQQGDSGRRTFVVATGCARTAVGARR